MRAVHNGNVDETPVEFTWLVGGDAPDVTITANPAEVTDSSTATFEFGAVGRNLSYECALSSVVQVGTSTQTTTGVLSPCVSPKTYNGLPRGEHTFEVRVMVPDEFPEGEITTYEWTVADLTPPETTIEFGPAEGSTVYSQTATFAFDSSNPNATFDCRLDNAATFTACPVPSVYTNLSQGEHTLRVQSISQYGIRLGTIVQRTWSVIPDTQAPVTEIIDAPTGQIEYVEGMEGIISFVSEAGATFECSLDTEPFGECTSPYEYADLEIGVHTFRVRATDLEGNTENPAASASWEVIPDTTAPVTQLNAKPPLETPDITATFTFSSNEFGAEFECALDAETLDGTGCEMPMIYEDLAPGLHTFQVRAIDLADPPNIGNTVSYKWRVIDASDGTPPVTLIHDGPPTTTNSVLASFMFTSEIGATFECQVDTEPIEECEVPYEVELDPETASGLHTFRVRATDLGLNVGDWATYQWTIVGPPETTIDAPLPPATGAPANATFTLLVRPDQLRLLLRARRGRAHALLLAEDVQRT